MIEGKKIVFFDGVCNLCNSSIDFFIRNKNENSEVYFASLQSDLAQKSLPKSLQNLSSIVYFDGKKFHNESSAVLNISKELKNPYPLATAFKIIPPVLRDVVYKYVAKNRYKWFGKRETCRLPSPEERKLFLE